MNPRWRGLLVAALCLAGARPAGAVEVSTAVVNPDAYRIRVDDVLSIFVWQQEDLTREAVVQPDGRILLPLARDIQAAGRTRDELAHDITARLSQYLKQPEVTVTVKRYGFAKIMLLGQVAKPGPQEYRVGMTLMELLGEVGGFGEDAVITNIRLARRTTARPGVRTMKVNAKRILYKGDPDVFLEPGDVIYVPRAALASFNKLMSTILTPMTLLIAVLAAVATLSRR